MLVSAGASVSVTSDDFPEPETPVTTVKVPSSTLALAFLRLLARAPVSRMDPRRGLRLFSGSLMRLFPVR